MHDANIVVCYTLNKHTTNNNCLDTTQLLTMKKETLPNSTPTNFRYTVISVVYLW